MWLAFEGVPVHLVQFAVEKLEAVPVDTICHRQDVEHLASAEDRPLPGLVQCEVQPEDRIGRLDSAELPGAEHRGAGDERDGVGRVEADVALELPPPPPTTEKLLLFSAIRYP